MENAHSRLAALGVLLATAGGALLPTSVLSCSPRWPQEGQHQKTVTWRMPTNLLHPEGLHGHSRYTIFTVSKNVVVVTVPSTPQQGVGRRWWRTEGQ